MSLLQPDLLCSTVADIDFEALARAGRTAVMVDVDNTIAFLHAPQPVTTAAESLRRARERGCISALCLVSNTIWGRAREQRVRDMAAALEAHAVCARLWEAKPRPAPFLRALGLMQAEARHSVMIGDQVFTDVAGAAALGIYTVLVEPLGPDAWFTRWSGRRRREQRLREQWAVGGGVV